MATPDGKALVTLDLSNTSTWVEKINEYINMNDALKISTREISYQYAKKYAESSFDEKAMLRLLKSE